MSRRTFQQWLDDQGDYWITKRKLQEKNFLRPVSCGSSFFEQAVADFHRFATYSQNAPAAPAAAIPASQGLSAPPPASAPIPMLPICPATLVYIQKVRALVRLLERKFRKGILTWDEFYGLQKMLLPMYPEGELRAQLANLRDQFTQRAPAHLKAAYEKSGPIPIDTAPYQVVLADALHLRDELSTMDTYRPHQELKRNRITFDLFGALIVVLGTEAIVGIIVALGTAWHYRDLSKATFPFLVIVMMLGALGATVSSQRRLQQSFDEDGSILNSTRFVGSGVGAKLAPFQGSVFAVVLIFIIYSGLATDISVTIIPNATKPPPAVSSPTPQPGSNPAASPKPNSSPAMSPLPATPPTVSASPIPFLESSAKVTPTANPEKFSAKMIPAATEPSADVSSPTPQPGSSPAASPKPNSSPATSPHLATLPTVLASPIPSPQPAAKVTPPGNSKKISATRIPDATQPPAAASSPTPQPGSSPTASPKPNSSPATSPLPATLPTVLASPIPSPKPSAKATPPGSSDKLPKGQSPLSSNPQDSSAQNGEAAETQINPKSDASRLSRALMFLFGPENGTEYAKILVYAFLAGFAERLVPDTLDRLSMKAGK